ncbi:MAG: guanylate kinase [Minwuia sp.]|uniref:guanylate kinase n=1 Tax=Minwuia sp. TaxID=2493630 RepID=UPI003A85518A
MLVLSSPSGAGKTTISRRLLAEETDLQMSVSVTTRPQRKGEEEGVDYYFVDRARFDEMVAHGELLEHATVFDNSYGTPAGPVEKALTAGRDVLFDVDWQGAQQMRGKMETDIVSVFILPPSMAELERRLRTRGRDPEDVIARRMSKAAGEISHYDGYDYVVINHEVEACLDEVRNILHAERNRRKRMPWLVEFVAGLVDPYRNA